MAEICDQEDIRDLTIMASAGAISYRVFDKPIAGKTVHFPAREAIEPERYRDGIVRSRQEPL